MDVKLSELRTNLTKVMEQVKNGEVVEVTERGMVIAMLVPPPMYFERKNQWQAGPTEKGTWFGGDLERAKTAQRGRDDLLRGVNRKS